MERYTYFDGGKWRLKIGDTEYSGDWVDRLAAYEEIGLEPEDMKKAFNEDATLKLAGQILGVTPGRLRELAQAEKEGRIVVLPCSVGDPVFMGTGRYKITGYEEDVCDGFYIGRDGVLQVKAQNYNGNHGTYGVIGQTAELTREAAEAALEEMEAEHEQTD
ncbi:hypothetical protein [Ruthenibacterium sp.]|uniref:hypothetical protein n=1 Tax=Ruthenibacterium sp. TaxID=1905345 RepID=UPI00257DEEB4|nr:hypothetical protein [Ruthenibacterium sp.]MBQ1359406.1 hypothetical protein [Ruthenibacterium sp.]